MTKHKSSDERREQILTAAKRCFIERGYESTRMSDISRESGLSKGGIYFHFDSKMQVFMSLVEDEVDRSLQELETISAGAGSLSEKLTVLAQTFLMNFSSQHDRPNFFIVMSEVALREDQVKDKLIETQEHYIELFTQIFEHGVETGEVRPVNPRAAAIYVKSLMDGLEGNIALGMDLDLGTLIPTGLDMLTNGLLRGSAATTTDS